MSLIRWDPFGDADTLFNRLMPSGFARFPRLPLESNGGPKLDWLPSADISETDKEYVIRAKLPAVKKEDVQVTLNDGMITFLVPNSRVESGVEALLPSVPKHQLPQRTRTTRD